MRRRVEAVNAVIRRHIDPDQLQIAIVASDAQAMVEAIATEAPSPIEYAAEVPEEVRAEDRQIVRYELGIPRDRMRVIPVAELF